MSKRKYYRRFLDCGRIMWLDLLGGNSKVSSFPEILSFSTDQSWLKVPCFHVVSLFEALEMFLRRNQRTQIWFQCCVPFLFSVRTDQSKRSFLTSDVLPRYINMCKCQTKANVHVRCAERVFKKCLHINFETIKQTLAQGDHCAVQRPKFSMLWLSVPSVCFLKLIVQQSLMHWISECRPEVEARCKIKLFFSGKKCWFPL